MPPARNPPSLSSISVRSSSSSRFHLHRSIDTNRHHFLVRRNGLSGNALLGAILGSVLGVLLFLMIALGVIVIIKRRRRGNDRRKESLSSTAALNAPRQQQRQHQPVQQQQKRKSWVSSMWGATDGGEAETQGGLEGYREEMREHHNRKTEEGEGEAGVMGVRREGTVARKERERKAKSASNGLWWMGGGQKSPRTPVMEEGEKSPRKEEEEEEECPPVPLTPLWKKDVRGGGSADNGLRKELEGG